MKVLSNYKVKRNLNINHTIVDNDVIIMGPDDNNYYRLNAVGAKIWNMLGSSELLIDSIVEELQTSYNISKEQAMHDTTAFIEIMIQKNIFCMT